MQSAGRVWKGSVFYFNIVKMICSREDEYRRRTRENEKREDKYPPKRQDSEKPKEPEPKIEPKQEPVAASAPDFDFEEGNRWWY